MASASLIHYEGVKTRDHISQLAQSGRSQVMEHKNCPRVAMS